MLSSLTLIYFNPSHSANAPNPIETTDSGIVIEVNEVQFLNADVTMEVIVDDNVTDDKLVQSLKAEFGMEVTELPNETLVI